MRMVFSGYEQEPSPALVRHDALREPGEGAAVLRTAEGRALTTEDARDTEEAGFFYGNFHHRHGHPDESKSPPSLAKERRELRMGHPGLLLQSRHDLSVTVKFQEGP